jgi:hypothetical protein
MPAGGPLEPAGNGRPRWMAAGRRAPLPGAAGHRIRRTGRLVRRIPGRAGCTPLTCGFKVRKNRNRPDPVADDPSAYCDAMASVRDVRMPCCVCGDPWTFDSTDYVTLVRVGARFEHGKLVERPAASPATKARAAA